MSYELYREFAAGALAGALLVIFMQFATLVLGLRRMVRKKRYPDTCPRDMLKDPSESLMNALSLATEECTDVAWLNIVFQRYFVELSRSSTFYEKVKETLVKKLSLAFSTGILKRVRFRDISFGSEAPYIRTIRALSDNELEELLARTGEKRARRPAGFSQVSLLMDVEYAAGDNCMYVDADLIKGYSIPIMVRLQPFRGQLVVRVPASNYHTRLELCFLENPGFDFSVEAAFAKNDTVFFSSSVSTLLKRLCRYVAKMYIYPNWYYYYLPMLVSRSKIIAYPYYPVSAGNIEAAMQQIREIKNLLSLDFAIITKKGNVIFRKTKSTVNSSSEPLMRAEIEMPPEKISRIGEMFRTPEDLFNPFAGVVSAYEGTKVIETYAPHLARVHVVIAGEVFEFIRITVDDMLLYQLTDPAEPQFLLLYREPKRILVVQYASRSSLFRLGQFRIQKLVGKLEEEELKVWGSARLFKLFDLSVRAAGSAKRIFGRANKPSQPKKKEEPPKDPARAQYVSDGYALDTSSQESVSEVAIIESHFRAIETRILGDMRAPDAQIDLPYTAAELKDVLKLSVTRASLFGEFTLMEDIELAVGIRSTSMAAPSGQFVQLLSYSNPEGDLVIGRILLSEEFQGVAVAARIQPSCISLFTDGGFVVHCREFEHIIRTRVEQSRLVPGEPQELPKRFTRSFDTAAGIIITSETPTQCEIFIGRGERVLRGEISLQQPCTVILGRLNEDTNLQVSIRTKKGTATLKEVPNSVDQLTYIEGSFILKKKGEITLPIGPGYAHWIFPWTAKAKDKDKDKSGYINGSGYANFNQPTTLTWVQQESCPTTSISAASIKPFNTTTTPTEPASSASPNLSSPQY
ncbi:hypothetical protein NEHOM01_0521 [Nematocida homosporus]|uniref:uncharacterized protein n=1 Tax=Nematocida homosporus TaxID=1912981 RepID=UPI0022210B20|nr:uncharacterized protein NEHOM01_0521 [Nematocida homosporus]KAI5184970.1 hypothetical protein NEHOM01_0521 [Nematocida homosporus]